MLENYEKDKYGVIHQINSQPFTYDEDYIKRSYDPKLTQLMAYLRLGFLLAHITPHSLLDVGFGDAAFLRAAENIIPHCYGYDTFDNPYYRQAPLTDYYDVITFFDSLEHFHQLPIHQLNTNYILISVPECHYPSDQWFDKWKHRKPNEHLHHFSRTALKNLLAAHNYTLLTESNLEDTIRKGPEPKNILTAIFAKTRTT